MTIDKNYVDEHMQDKNILYVPIVSSINRETNQYNLDSDGNIARFITFFEHHHKYHKLVIVLPKNNESHKIIDSWSYCNNVDIIWSDNFGNHAGEQRNDPEVYREILKEIEYYIDESNIPINTIIFESQGLGEELIDIDCNIEAELVYWCPVCKIDDNHTRSFLEGYDEINKRLFSSCDWCIVESPMQLNKFSFPDTSIYPYYQMVDRDIKYFGYVSELEWKDTIAILDNIKVPVYYLPYRLTDEGYKIDEVIDFINMDVAEHVIVYYTDPNNSGYMDKIKNKFNNNIHCIKLSSDRNSHFTMLSCENVIVPYFEDLDFVNHALLWEMMSIKSKCSFAITKEQWDKNPYDVKSCDRCFYIDINIL